MDNPLFIIFIVLVAIVFIWLLIEKFIINYTRKKFTHIIHVNGTRGKSTVCRLLDGILREQGFRVFTKTTGTIASYIDCEGIEYSIKRIGVANIREQIRIMHLAAKQKAEVLIIECMAINPELQAISQHQILQADIVVITNVREDHTLEMGKTLPEIAASLATTVPFNGTLVTSYDVEDPIFAKKCNEQNSQLLVAKHYQTNNNKNIMEENIDLVLKVSETLGIPLDVALVGISKYHPDPGTLNIFTIKDTTFINGFSINDPASTKKILDKLASQYAVEDMTFLLNNRHDRPIRTQQLVDLLQQIPCKKIIVSGAHQQYVKRRLKNKFPTIVENFKNVESLLQEKTIFAFGNIAHQGINILNYFKSNGEKTYG